MTADTEAPTRPCPHPEHRLGTHGRLKKRQRVCLQCGATVTLRQHPTRPRKERP